MFVVMSIQSFADMEVRVSVFGNRPVPLAGIDGDGPKHYLAVFETREAAEKWADGSPVLELESKAKVPA